MNFLSPFLGRILAAWIAGLVGWLATHYGVTIDSAQQQAFVEHLVGIVIPIVLTIYSIAHKALDKHLNPGDAASSHIAAEEQREHDRLVR